MKVNQMNEWQEQVRRVMWSHWLAVGIGVLGLVTGYTAFGLAMCAAAVCIWLKNKERS